MKNVKKTMQEYIPYLYTGSLEYDQHSKDLVILECIIAADELGLDALVKRMKKYLDGNKEILHKDPIGTLQIVGQHELFKDITEYCLEIISKEPEILFHLRSFHYWKIRLLL